MRCLHCEFAVPPPARLVAPPENRSAAPRSGTTPDLRATNCNIPLLYRNGIESRQIAWTCEGFQCVGDRRGPLAVQRLTDEAHSAKVARFPDSCFNQKRLAETTTAHGRTGI